MKKSLLFLFTLILGSTLMISCGAKRVENTEVPKEAAAAPEAAEPTAEPTPDTTLHYTVQPKDTLWDIAGKSKIYGDSFQWPLIFKSNRDKIQDPDLIYPQQDLLVLKTVSGEEVKNARKLSSETGKYQKHSEPRKKLPIDYF